MTISQRLNQLYRLQLLLTASSTVLTITTTVSKTITPVKISSVLPIISSAAQTIIVVVAAYTMSLAREATNKAILDASKCLLRNGVKIQQHQLSAFTRQPNLFDRLGSGCCSVGRVVASHTRGSSVQNQSSVNF